jgi:hypothetical protein
MQAEEMIIAALPLPFTKPVLALDIVLNVSASFFWIAYHEI